MLPTIISSRVKRRIEVMALLKADISQKDIARQLNISRRTIYNISKRDSPEDKKRNRVATKLTPTTKVKIEKEMNNVAFASVRKCAKLLNFSDNYTSRDKKISCTSITRFLKTTDWGRRAYKIRKEPLMSAKNISDRIKFANLVKVEGYIGNTRNAIELRRHILWTDESPILLNPEPNTQNLRIRIKDKADIPTVKVPKKSVKIMVAGGICARGVTELFILDDKLTINGLFYADHILPIYFSAMANQNLFPKQKLVTFMQDGAPAHTSKSNLDLIASKVDKVWSRNVWPGNSPDLNPVEHVWSSLQDSVFIEPRPRNRQELVYRVKETWYALKPEQLEKLSQSLVKRITQVEERDGRKTDY